MLTPGERSEYDASGTAVEIDADFAFVGAGGADGGRGAVVVFRKTPLPPSP